MSATFALTGVLRNERVGRRRISAAMHAWLSKALVTPKCKKAPDEFLSLYKQIQLLYTVAVRKRKLLGFRPNAWYSGVPDEDVAALQLLHPDLVLHEAANTDKGGLPIPSVIAMALALRFRCEWTIRLVDFNNAHVALSTIASDLDVRGKHDRLLIVGLRDSKDDDRVRYPARDLYHLLNRADTLFQPLGFSLASAVITVGAVGGRSTQHAMPIRKCSYNGNTIWMLCNSHGLPCRVIGPDGMGNTQLGQAAWLNDMAKRVAPSRIPKDFSTRSVDNQLDWLETQAGLRRAPEVSGAPVPVSARIYNLQAHLDKKYYWFPPEEYGTEVPFRSLPVLKEVVFVFEPGYVVGVGGLWSALRFRDAWSGGHSLALLDVRRTKRQIARATLDALARDNRVLTARDQQIVAVVALLSAVSVVALVLVSMAVGWVYYARLRRNGASARSTRAALAFALVNTTTGIPLGLINPTLRSRA